MKKPAVFIDRDGTISEEVGYVNHPARFRVFPYSAEAIRKLNDNDWLAILVTNQAGVARGYFSEDVITTVHDQLNKELASTDTHDSMRFITALTIRPWGNLRIDWIVIVENRKPV